MPHQTFDDPVVLFDDPTVLFDGGTQVYFLPPTTRTWPPRNRWAHYGVRRASVARFMLDYRRGDDVTIAGTTYRGGNWHGPLTDQQITDITAAGHGARLVTVDDISDLPPGLD